MEYHLYNEFRNGDVFFSRALIDIIHKQMSENDTITYHHKCPKGILKDLPFVLEADLNGHCIRGNTINKTSDSCYYINTWYGQNDFKFVINGTAACLQTTHQICQNLCNVLFDSHTVPQNENLYPSLDLNFSLNLNTRLSAKCNVLFCNDNSMSGQSNNMKFDNTIKFLSGKFPDTIFYVTQKTFNCTNKNIIFTDDVFSCRPNLLEISRLSEKCDIIVGRASGPYSYSMTKTNIMDPKKTFVSTASIMLPGIWDTRFHACSYYHLGSVTEQKLTDFLTTKIDEIDKNNF